TFAGLEHLRGELGSFGKGLSQIDAACDPELGGRDEPATFAAVDTFDLKEDAVRLDASDLAANDRADGELRASDGLRRPFRRRQERLERERDARLAFVVGLDFENLRLDDLAGLEGSLARFGFRDEPIDAAEVDEGAEVANGRDGAANDLTLLERTEDLFAAALCFRFEHASPRENDASSAVFD